MPFKTGIPEDASFCDLVDLFKQVKGKTEK